jgi:hypothetical protein
MKAPKCRLCGDHHWGTCFANVPPAPLTKSPEKAIEPQVSEAMPKPPFDRIAYQRDYMRKWRANKRAKALAEKAV